MVVETFYVLKETFAASNKTSFELVDVSIQVDLPVDVINYDSDDETMGRKRFPVFRTKKGIPLYSKEDIREQYCITNKQLHVLETAQARKLFGCIPNQDWKSCRRASLLSSCLRKTKSASDDNLAGLRPSPPIEPPPLTWEPSSPAAEGTSATVKTTNSNSPPSDGDGGFELDRPPLPKSLRQTFDEELATAVLRRKAKLESVVDFKRHTWATEDVEGHEMFNGEDIGAVSDGNLSSRRPTLLRLRSHDSGNSDVGSNDIELDMGRIRMAKTMPNTPDLSHGNRCRRQAKTPELSLDERRQKHVSFDSAALIYAHPSTAASSTASFATSSASATVSASPSSRRFTMASSKMSPDRKSQERLLDIGGMKKSESTGFSTTKRQQQHGSIRSLDFISSLTPKMYQSALMKLRKPTKTQATQTEASVTERIAIPAPVLAYLTLSPRSHSRSDTDYRLRGLSDVKMTVIELNDSGYQYTIKKRHAGRSKSSPASAHQHHQRPIKFFSPANGTNNGQKEIMVTFKPYNHLNNNKIGNGNGGGHKLLKTCSESNVLNGTPYLDLTGEGKQDQEVDIGDGELEELIRERSESDPMLLDTDLIDDMESPVANGGDTRRQRSRSVTQTTAFHIMLSRDDVQPEITSKVAENGRHVGISPKTSIETSDGGSGSQYHSLTDQSASSTPTPLHSSTSGKASKVIKSPGKTLNEQLTQLPQLPSCETDKTITYSSDTEYGSIQSEDSHTLIDIEMADETGQQQQQQTNLPQSISESRQRRPLMVSHLTKRLSIGSSRGSSDGRFLSPKDVLTSPDSESSWSESALITQPEGTSETSDDYQTATEQLTESETKRRPFLILPPPLSLVHPTDKLEDTPESIDGTTTTDTTYFTQIYGGNGNGIGGPMGSNLQSPRSPHASVLSIESSTSGSYTLDSDGNGRKLSSSSTICSESDKELETLFASAKAIHITQDDSQLVEEVQEVFGDGVEDEEAVTPTPEVSSWFARPRSRTEGNEELDRKASTCDTADRSVSVENVAKSSTEVIERSYSFAAIRLKFERMTELTKDSSRDRSSSAETTATITDGGASASTSSLAETSKSNVVKRKKPEIAAKPSTLISAKSKVESDIVESDHKATARKSAGPSLGATASSGHVPSGGNGHRKEYRRSVSESPEAVWRCPDLSIPRSASDVHMDVEHAGPLGVGGVKTRHRSRSQDKDTLGSTSHTHRKSSALRHQQRHIEESSSSTSSVFFPPTEEKKPIRQPKVDHKRTSERRKTTGSYSFDIGELKGHDDNQRRRERSLPGSTEHLDGEGDRRVGVGQSNLSKSLPDRQMELYEMSKILCTECGEKLRKIGDDLSEGSRNWSESTEAQDTLSVGGQQRQPKDRGSVPEITVASSTESLQLRSSGGAIDSPGLSSSQGSSWADSSPTSLMPTAHDHEEEDEDVGIYADSYRNSSWIYIGDSEELQVWQGGKAVANQSTDKKPSQGAEGVELRRTDSLDSTSSEKEFRRKYQAVTHRMVHRKSSIEMYKRLSNRTFECDKTVVVQRKSGEFGFRIHGSRPVVVSAIEPDTAAEQCGLEVGDIIIAVNGINVIDASHSEVVKIAHAGCETLRLDLARTCHVLTPVISSEQSHLPVHCGFLHRQTTLLHKWCRRWFILKHDHCLYYYKNQQSKEPLGAVMLLNYSVSRALDVGRPFAFRLTKFGSASYCFAADDEENMNRWASLINQYSSMSGQIDPWIEISTRNVQLPALSIQLPDCHGYLGKLGHRWKTWKRRYCVLKDACVYFYHDINSTTSIGVAHLHGYRIQSCPVSGRKYTFEAIPPELKMKHFHFYADNETDRKRWLAALEYSIDRWIKVG
ncbi:hypothetical protein CHUAL_005870 [Chamberlinius hualienensis]